MYGWVYGLLGPRRRWLCVGRILRLGGLDLMIRWTFEAMMPSYSFTFDYAFVAGASILLYNTYTLVGAVWLIRSHHGWRAWEIQRLQYVQSTASKSMPRPPPLPPGQLPLEFVHANRLTNSVTTNDRIVESAWILDGNVRVMVSCHTCKGNVLCENHRRFL